jgi:hypothetical protein
MIGWRVSLIGEDQELDLLMQSMPDDPDWSMTKDQGGYYLTPTPVFHEGEIEAVHTRAANWANRINLAGPLLLPRFQRISFTLEYVKNDGRKLHFAFQAFAGASGFAAAAGVALGPDGKPVRAQIPPIASMARAIARHNVAEAVQLFHGRRDDFTQLCNVIEMVRNSLGSDIPRTWVSHTKLELLERTAQFRQTAGDTARHFVKAKGKPTPKPMLLAEAQEIVRQILIHWLQTLS